MTTFFVLVRKEFGEIFREKRFPIFAFAYTAILGLITLGLIQAIQDASNKGATAVVPAALTVIAALFFFDLLGLIMLVAAFVLDSIGKERDAGMLGLLLTSRAGPSTILAAKTTFGLLVYVIAAGLGLLVAAIMGYALGDIVLQGIFLFYAGPLLILFVFLLGTALLFSAVTSTARFSLVVGLAVYLPLFLIGGTPLFAGILAYVPALKTFVDWTPFAVAVAQMNWLLYGTPLNILKPIVTVIIGLAALATAFVLFRRQEVP